MSTKIRDPDAKNAEMQKRDSETHHKGFRDFEIGRKFAETQDFQKTIRHPFFNSIYSSGSGSDSAYTRTALEMKRMHEDPLIHAQNIKESSCSRGIILFLGLVSVCLKVLVPVKYGDDRIIH